MKKLLFLLPALAFAGDPPKEEFYSKASVPNIIISKSDFDKLENIPVLILSKDAQIQTDFNSNNNAIISISQEKEKFIELQEKYNKECTHNENLMGIVKALHQRFPNMFIPFNERQDIIDEVLLPHMRDIEEGYIYEEWGSKIDKPSYNSERQSALFRILLDTRKIIGELEEKEKNHIAIGLLNAEWHHQEYIKEVWDMQIVIPEHLKIVIDKFPKPYNY